MTAPDPEVEELDRIAADAYKSWANSHCSIIQALRRAGEAGRALGRDKERERQERAAAPNLPPGLFSEYHRLDPMWQTLVRERDDAVRALSDARAEGAREVVTALCTFSRDVGDLLDALAVDERGLPTGIVAAIRARGDAPAQPDRMRTVLQMWLDWANCKEPIYDETEEHDLSRINDLAQLSREALGLEGGKTLVGAATTSGISELRARVAELEREVERLNTLGRCDHTLNQISADRIDERDARIAELEVELGAVNASLVDPAWRDSRIAELEQALREVLIVLPAGHIALSIISAALAGKREEDAVRWDDRVREAEARHWPKRERIAEQALRDVAKSCRALAEREGDPVSSGTAGLCVQRIELALIELGKREEDDEPPDWDGESDPGPECPRCGAIDAGRASGLCVTCTGHVKWERARRHPPTVEIDAGLARLLSRQRGVTVIREAADPLHPNGRCTCAGEGRCEWCLDAKRRGG